MLGLNKIQRKNNYSDIQKCNDLNIYKTYNYLHFQKLQGNRRVNRSHLNRLLASIEEKSLIVPIIVNENYQIIDGQTRYECWKMLGKPIYFIKISGYGLPEVQRLNNNMKKWNYNDFLDSYCELGYKDYLLFRDFKNKYGFDNRSSITMLKQSAGGKDTKDFQEGKFRVKNYSIACKWATEITKIKKYYYGYNRRAFVTAMLHLLNHENFEMKILIQKLKYQSSKLVDCTNKTQYVTLLQDIYNFKSTKKVNLIYN